MNEDELLKNLAKTDRQDQKNTNQLTANAPIQTMSDFVRATKDFDIVESLRRFETPEIVARREKLFRSYVRT